MGDWGICYRNDRHDSQGAKGPGKNQRFVFFEREEQCKKERLVAQLRKEDEQEARDNAFPKRAVAQESYRYDLMLLLVNTARSFLMEYADFVLR